MSEHLEILYCAGRGPGWAPIDSMVALAGQLLDARITTVQDHGEVGIGMKASAMLPRRRRGHTKLLVIAATPGLLAYGARTQYWLRGYARTAAWVIDSFWTDRISRFALNGHFDDIFITDRSLVDEWKNLTGSEIHHLPWGADTLAYDVQAVERPIDLLRVGRQPPAWDDDDTVRERAADYGLIAQGRPPFSEDSQSSQRNVRDALLNAKFVLAFHNLVSPASYTHPTRSYLTGRWTNALAAGTTVVGAAPKESGGVLWPGATIEIEPNDLIGGLEQIRRVADEWSPRQAVEQSHRARATLDWRRRIATISDTLELTPTDRLRTELARLEKSRGAGG